jgi:hypothetical protein
VGAAVTTSTPLGARRKRDVEPDCRRLGILEQRNMDSGLIRQGSRRSACDDGDFAAQLIRRQQRKSVTTPKPSGVKPVRPLLGFDQPHLIVGNCHRLRAIRGFEAALPLLRTASSR